MSKGEEALSKITAKEEPILVPPPYEETYHVIRIAEKVHETQATVIHVHTATPKQVYDFRMMRGALIPVPQAVCEVLDETVYPVYRQPTDQELIEGKKEKVISQGRRVAYEKVFRNIPKDVYMALRTRATDPKAIPITEAEIEKMLNKRPN